MTRPPNASRPGEQATSPGRPPATATRRPAPRAARPSFATASSSAGPDTSGRRRLPPVNQHCHARVTRTDGIGPSSTTSEICSAVASPHRKPVPTRNRTNGRYRGSQPRKDQEHLGRGEQTHLIGRRGCLRQFHPVARVIRPITEPDRGLHRRRQQPVHVRNSRSSMSQWSEPLGLHVVQPAGDLPQTHRLDRGRTQPAAQVIPQLRAIPRYLPR